MKRSRAEEPVGSGPAAKFSGRPAASPEPFSKSLPPDGFMPCPTEISVLNEFKPPDSVRASIGILLSSSLVGSIVKVSKVPASDSDDPSRGTS